jgi:hypothetical protein
VVKSVDEMGNMPESLQAIGHFYPEKHALITSIPFVWDLGLKRLFRTVHDVVSPSTDNESRDKFYDNVFNHLKVGGTDVPQGKTTLKIADQVRMYEAPLD